MQKKPKVCLVSHSWNEADQLPALFKNISQQTLLPALWLFIDDGSTDNTPEVLAQLSKKYPQLKLKIIQMPKKTKGNLDTIGIALKKAFKSLEEHYDFYVLVDVDTRLPKNYIEKITEKFYHDPKLTVASGVITVNGIPESNKRKFARGTGMTIRGEFLEKLVDQIPEVKIDAWINTKSRIYGFKTFEFDDLKIIQTRPTTQRTAKGSFRNGRLAYYFNYNFLLVLAKALYYLILRKRGSDILRGYWYTKREGWKIKDKEIKTYYHSRIFIDYLKVLVERLNFI